MTVEIDTRREKCDGDAVQPADRVIVRAGEEDTAGRQGERAIRAQREALPIRGIGDGEGVDRARDRLRGVVDDLRMIRRHPQWESIPIVVLTGLNDDNKLVARAKELGVNDLVPKASFGFDDLMTRIKKAITSPASPTAN